MDPFPFHVLNVLMHALASIMVLALANHLFAKLEAQPSSSSSSSTSETTTAPAVRSAADDGRPSSRSKRHATPQKQQQTDTRSKQDKGPLSLSEAEDDGRLLWLQQAVMWDKQPRLWMVGSPQAQAQGFICALLFALHPIHVEVSMRLGNRAF